MSEVLAADDIPQIDYGAATNHLLSRVTSWSDGLHQNFDEAKIPFRRGSKITGVSLGSVLITISGLIVESTDALAMTAIDDLKTAVQGDGNREFTLYRYHNSTAGRYRYHANCVCKSLTFDRDNMLARKIPYTLTVKSQDGLCIDSTAPATQETSLEGNTKILLTAGQFLVVTQADSGNPVFAADHLGNLDIHGSLNENMSLANLNTIVNGVL